MATAKNSGKHIKRSPNDVIRAAHSFCKYHDLFHRHLERGNRVSSSLDRGAFRRPHDLLPQEVLHLLGAGQRSSSYAYGPEVGDEKVRELIMQIENLRHGTSYTMDNVAMVPGAWAALDFALEEILHFSKGSLDNGKVAVIGPTLYQMFHRPIQHYGMEVVAYDFVVPGAEHVPTAMEDLEDIFRNEPKVIVITNPNNPDGKYFPPHLLKEVVERAKEEGIYVLVDEIQNSLPRQGKELGYGSWIEAPNVIRVDSPSKRYALAEHRVGWIIADAKLLGTNRAKGTSRMEGIVGRMSGLMGNAPRAANTALAYLLERESEMVRTGKDFLQTRSHELLAKERYVAERLRAMPRISEIILADACINTTVLFDLPLSDLELAERLMQAGTLLMPASGYGYETLPPALRITFAERDEKLQHSMDMLSQVLA